MSDSSERGAESVEVPLLDLRPQYESLRSEIDGALARVVESQHFVLGPEVEAFEREVAEYCGVPEAIGVGSGSDALLLGLMALGVQPGDQVLCPTYTFFATAGSVVRMGAEPVFVDCEPDTYNVSLESLERAAAGCRRLRAILPVHLYGQMADVVGLEALAQQLGVPLLEDAAQAIGARDSQGRLAGAAGSLATFSFFPTKNLGGFGEGGLVTCHDPDVAETLRTLRVHGMKPKYYNAFVGVNARLDAIQAAVLRVKLPHLESWHARRGANAEMYDRLFASAGALPSTVALGEGELPLRYPVRPPAPARHIYNQYVVRVPADLRDGLRAHLAERRIGSEIYYPVPLHLQACFKELGPPPGSLPVAEAAALETVALPIFPDLSTAQLEAVAGTIVDFLADSR
ncbi:MAG: DegT/DnrJ/EryC1/StrS family aminotransferase [Myxococcales bacterium]|nr:DegT/DnrJ/EryC1/StrS family aminotransferase [Myxococcales bacterium]